MKIQIKTILLMTVLLQTSNAFSKVDLPELTKYEKNILVDIFGITSMYSANAVFRILNKKAIKKLNTLRLQEISRFENLKAEVKILKIQLEQLEVRPFTNRAHAQEFFADAGDLSRKITNQEEEILRIQKVIAPFDKSNFKKILKKMDILHPETAKSMRSSIKMQRFARLSLFTSAVFGIDLLLNVIRESQQDEELTNRMLAQFEIAADHFQEAAESLRQQSENFDMDSFLDF